MKIVGIIPARYESTRLPGKPLADICGKPMIQHVYERALLSKLDEVIIACDDERIAKACENFSGNYVMTRKDHENGSSRIAEVSDKIDADFVINIQGDEPLISPLAINSIIEVFKNNEDEDCVTLKSKIIDEEDVDNPNVVKVICDLNDYAIYFSRATIPYKRNDITFDYFKHIGIYGYKKAFLLKYIELQTTALEQIESLEQLRILTHGYKIKVCETEEVFIGVDTNEDLLKVRQLIGNA